MQIDTKQLADDITKVMELDKHRTQGEWYLDGSDGDGSPLMVRCGDVLVCDTYERNKPHDAQFIASAPLMIDIIRRQREVIYLAHQTLVYARDESNPDSDVIESWNTAMGRKVSILLNGIKSALEQTDIYETHAELEIALLELDKKCD